MRTIYRTIRRARYWLHHNLSLDPNHYNRCRWVSYEAKHNR